MWESIVCALLLDHLFGEPRRAHPLVAFGRYARWIETHLYADRFGRAPFAVFAAIAPWLLLAWALSRMELLQTLVGIVVLYLAIGLRSLREHALPVAAALEQEHMDDARRLVARIVSRDTADLDASQVAAAATESVLENGNDAVFAALFWFVVAGAAGVVLYRLANTLDAMWGYRNARYRRFGWFAARLDDALNGIPARLTALSYALAGHCRRAIACWRQQAAAWDSPNAGPVMAAGAGALGVRLGGRAPYDGHWHERPALGWGDAPDAQAIRRALHLLYRAVAIWLVALLLIGML
ncbi:adenosylcobinamide-phosphate synthase CbiB [Tahibacter sp.]|uniref:adenosylcobinamide-phosphate synthase CbiB n=1 Tax=Tahibacter sp. TaxID=2056211 RepID=UPI0028C49D4B|nr:adenosylcobinamide-phosphate synthase CbiB [Tahibacter sp.]